MIVPNIVHAQTQARDLLETLEAASITPSIEEYKENDDQVVIYLFWGQTCEHCHEFLEFINSNLEEYKDKIKMRSYETSRNDDNYAIQKKVANWFEVKNTGVPLIVIGENTFYGYAGSETGEKIKIAINDVYSQTERYDVFEEMKNGNPKTEKQNVMLFMLIPIVLFGVIGYIYIQVKR